MSFEKWETRIISGNSKIVIMTKPFMLTKPSWIKPIQHTHKPKEYFFRKFQLFNLCFYRDKNRLVSFRALNETSAFMTTWIIVVCMLYSFMRYYFHGPKRVKNDEEMLQDTVKQNTVGNCFVRKICIFGSKIHSLFLSLVPSFLNRFLSFIVWV